MPETEVGGGKLTRGSRKPVSVSKEPGYRPWGTMEEELMESYLYYEGSVQGSWL